MSGEFERTISAQDGSSATISLHVPNDLKYFEGHFPGDPIVPGIAQLADIVEQSARTAWPNLGAIAAAKRIKFMIAIRPGDPLTLQLTRTGDALAFVLLKEGEIASRGTFLLRPASAG